MSNETTLKNLQRALQMELTAAHQYQLHAHVLDDWGLDKLATQMRSEMQEELVHADEFINRIMVVVDFEASPWYSDASDYSVIYTNCWGEMFVNRMSDTSEFNAFLTQLSAENRDIEMSYYVQRNTASFEKLIERAKQMTSVRNTKLV